METWIIGLVLLVLLAIVLTFLSLEVWRKDQTDEPEPGAIIADLAALHNVSQRASWDDLKGMYRCLEC